jgi:hypothetical protein
MGMVEAGPARRTRRVGVGIVEMVPEAPEDFARDNLLANLRNRSVLILLMILMAAQTADVVTTYAALGSRRYVEENPLFRVLIARSPVAAYSVKLLTVLWLALLSISYLRGRRAALALALAAMLSLSAPLMNFLLLLHS